jgi:hypothetical protein
MRFLPVLLLLGLALPARADEILFDDGRWQVVGVDASAEPEPILVTRDGAPLGAFAALRVLYDVGAGFVPVVTLYAGGAIEPTLPPPGVPGATALLGRYADCDVGLTAPLRFTALELPAQAPASRLELRCALSNGDSLASEKLRIRVLAPTAERTRVELRYRLVAQRDLCVDASQHEATDEFRAVELLTQYLSSTQQLSDSTRYVKAVDLDCDVFDCDLDKEWFCADLANTTGPVLDNPRRLEGRPLQLVHTTDSPAATPTLSLEARSPHFHQLKPQGSVTESSDPLARNVSFWADWVGVKRQYRAGQRVGRWHFALEALPPERRSCDHRQD